MKPTTCLKYSYVLVVMCLFTALTSANTKVDPKKGNPAGSSSQYYPSNVVEGQIGSNAQFPFDSPTDNIFEVTLPEGVAETDKVWLTYEVFGVKGHASISRSINGELALGGHLVTLNQSWELREEPLYPGWLQKGSNRIQFSLPGDVAYSYKIRNLGIRVEKNTRHSRAIIIDEAPQGAFYGSQAYIKGFVFGMDSERARVFVDGVQVANQTAAFEGILNKKTSGEHWSTGVRVVFPDGEVLHKTVRFKSSQPIDFKNHIPKAMPSELYREGLHLSIKGASLKLGNQTDDRDGLAINSLRYVDIPALDAGMVNVTRHALGYRFSSEQNFSPETTVSIGFDLDKIPDGYTEQDIKTYYFNYGTKHWVALTRDSLDLSGSQVISRAFSGGDMINGVLQVPESPETNAFTQTSIKDIKAADPSAGIRMMQPPSASNTGDAHLGYPINIPPGRQGMQPQIGIRYSSGGGNGWLGLGWDLQVPSIGLDTRWGVPRYDKNMETETYMVNGSQLFPVAHKGALVKRTDNKTFYPRVEGSFQKIVRYGKIPSEYRWEVTTKNGTRYFYGGYKSVDNSAVLRDGQGNIAHWALVRVEDSNGNFITYKHTVQLDSGNPRSNAVMGQQLYCTEIQYTGHGNDKGAYKVVFVRNRDLNETKRKDITINARYGFKLVTADLLRKIEVKYSGDGAEKNIRSYELLYGQGAFFKTLLNTIVEYDSEDREFTRHELEYYDDVRTDSTYQPYTSTTEQWSPGSDAVKGGFVTPNLGELFNDNASALSGTTTGGGGGGVAVTFGIFDGNIASKSNTIGGKVGFSSTVAKGMLAMVDINGDGLPDKVFAKDKNLWYRPNLFGPDGGTVFGEKRPISGVEQFSRSSTNTFSLGLEAHPLGAFVGYDNAKAKTTEKTYFSDVNGDMLQDIVVNGNVYFNHINAEGDPVFTRSSADTDSPINETGAVDAAVVVVDAKEQEELIDNHPLHDVVRMWTAPFNGTVAVSGTVAMAVGPRSDTDDGVRVTVQHKGNELWQATIGPHDTTKKIPQGVSAIHVKRGDRIYFRVQSVENGSNDLVDWDPEVSYTGKDGARRDANGKKKYVFQASEGFLLTNKQTSSTAIRGTIAIKSNFSKPITTDDLQIIIRKGAANDTIFQKKYGWNEVVDEPISYSGEAQADETYTFEVLSATNIDWNAISWNPELYYTASRDTLYPTVVDSKGNYLLTTHPVVDYSLYADHRLQGEIWEAKTDTTVHMSGLLQTAVDARGAVTFSIKKRNELILKQVLGAAAGKAASDTTAITVKQGDQLYLAFHTDNIDLADKVISAKATVGSTSIPASLHTQINPEERIFGSQYRHWGQFTYKANRERAQQPIKESLLKLDEASTVEVDMNTIQGADDLEGAYDPTQGDLVPMILVPEKKLWQGFDDLTFIRAGQMSSSRLGLDDISVSTPLSGGGARAINRVTKSVTKSVAAGGGAGGASVSASESWSTTTTTTEFMDMNGDSYPDIVTESHIQYSNANGSLADKGVPHGLPVNEAKARANGSTLGGSYISAKTNNTGSVTSAKSSLQQMKASLKGEQTKVSDAAKDAGSSVGVSGNFSTNVDESLNSWADINGDGLPDKVYQNGDAALNLGYTFAKREPFGFDQIRTGQSTDGGAGLGINIGNWSIAGGISLSSSGTQVNKALQDVNGDGLQDFLVRTEKEPLTVYLNTGNGFDTEGITWNGLDAISESISSGESINGAYTHCIPLPTPITPVFKLCFNPSVMASQGASKQKLQISDIDGDRFPDVLRSTNDGELKVKRSTIRRTNKLKTVKRPMGASFTLDYKPVGNTVNHPSTIWVLAQVELFDGLAGDGPDIMLDSFEYEGGFYDRNERDFYGFKTVKTHQLDTSKENTVYRTVVQNFKNDNYYEKGLLASMQLQDADGNPFTESINRYELKSVTSGNTLPDTKKEDDRGAAFPAVVETVNNFYEGQSAVGKSTRNTYTYDALGNLSGFTDFGEADGADDISSQISYHSQENSYVVGIPKKITVTANRKLLRERESSIDDRGNLTQLRKKLEDGSTATYDMKYDGYGNLTEALRPENRSGERMSVAYNYDAELHTYVEQVTDAYGYTSSASYDPRYGQLLNSVDLNGNEIRRTLDAQGRVRTVQGPLEIASGVPFTLAFTYEPDAEVPRALTQHYDPANPENYLEIMTFTDGLLRVVQVKKDGAIFNNPRAADNEKIIVSGRVAFDAFGRTLESRYPTLEEKGKQKEFSPDPDEVTPTKNSYDVLDRLRTSILPDGATTQMAYGFGSDRNGNQQFSTRVTDANGISKESFTNVRGLTTAVKEQYSQGSAIWTSYSYNPINELVQVLDDQGNTIESVYDHFGRRTQVTHPDAGTTTFTYDLASNLTARATANLSDSGKAITYAYDRERLTHIFYPENSVNNVTYTYGEPGAEHNRAGRIILQEDATGAQEFFYNPLGAVVKNIRTITVPAEDPLTYTTQWEYDTWNRIRKMTYPDGEELGYTYNVGGLLRSMQGKKNGTSYEYLTQLGYDKFEQRVYLSYGNGTQTTYQYEPERRRLATMVAVTATNREMMHNNYTYDKVNNILRLQNSVAVPEANLMGGATDSKYVYDDLYRLTEANGLHQTSSHEHRYNLEMEYNSVHSIVNKVQTHDRKDYEGEWEPRNKTTYTLDYSYGEAQPHAPKTIGEKAYGYDANGNQTSWESTVNGQRREMVWDEENRLQALADNGALHNYVYDAGGERVLKSSGKGQAVSVNGVPTGGSGKAGNYTMYVNPYLVVRNGSFTKHFFIEGQRIVSKLGEGTDGRQQEKAGGNGKQKINWAIKSAKLNGSINSLYNAMGIKPFKLVDGPGNNENSGNGNGNNGNGKNQEAFQYYFHPDHLGSSSYITDVNGEVYQHLEYFAFGETWVEEHSNTDRTPYLFNGKELDEETGLYYYGARYYDPITSVWQSVDPLAERTMTPYQFGYQNPVRYVDPDGLSSDDWVEKKNGDIYWDNNATSQATTKSGETYLGKNVLVGTHNRDASGNEAINTAKFDLYLESDKTGPSATIMGNTVPADINKYGTVAEGLYPAEYSIYKGDGAILINGGKGVPTVSGNPNNKLNYNADGSLKPISEHIVDEIFFHKGNYARPSLSTNSGSPISAGCQTGGCGKGTLPIYREFIKNAEGFKGSYYLRSKPVLTVPTIVPFSSDIPGKQ